MQNVLFSVALVPAGLFMGLRLTELVCYVTGTIASSFIVLFGLRAISNKAYRSITPRGRK